MRFALALLLAAAASDAPDWVARGSTTSGSAFYGVGSSDSREGDARHFATEAAARAEVGRLIHAMMTAALKAIPAGPEVAAAAERAGQKAEIVEHYVDPESTEFALARLDLVVVKDALANNSTLSAKQKAALASGADAAFQRVTGQPRR